MHAAAGSRPSRPHALPGDTGAPRFVRVYTLLLLVEIIGQLQYFPFPRISVCSHIGWQHDTSQNEKVNGIMPEIDLFNT